jgi:hypothetical protein
VEGVEDVEVEAVEVEAVGRKNSSIGSISESFL